MTTEPQADLTRADVAGIKKVSQRTVDRWVAAGILPAYRVGPRLIRFRAEDVANIGRKIKAAS